VALAAAVGLYTAYGDRLPSVSTWWDVAFLAVVVLPAVFALIWLALAWRNSRWLLPFAVVAAAVALLLHLLGFETLFDLAKLAALTAVGFWFLTVFEELSWIVLVALIIPWVDALSVKAGPTEYVVEEQPGFFEKIAYAFRIPGEESFAHLGPPDILFFALFLSASARFGLRVGWTWIGMTAGLGLTLVAAVWGNFSGLPALPGISLGFLVPNLDLLLIRARDARRARAAGEG
jgi:hypothetical protein